MGPTELLVVMVLLGLIAAVIAGLVLLGVRLAGGRRPAPHAPDLAERARALKAHGHPERAIMLVRGETGMSHEEAAGFVHRL